MTFVDTPVVKSIRDAGNNPLPFALTNGLVVFVQGIEVDLTPRNTGNGIVDSTDITQERHLVARIAFNAKRRHE